MPFCHSPSVADVCARDLINPIERGCLAVAYFTGVHRLRAEYVTLYFAPFLGSAAYTSPNMCILLFWRACTRIGKMYVYVYVYMCI